MSSENNNNSNGMIRVQINRRTNSSQSQQKSVATSKPAVTKKLNLFDRFFIVAQQEGEAQPTVTFTYPEKNDSESKDDAGLSKQVPQFCFPGWGSENDKNEVVVFTFSLTDVEGRRRYGFCHRVADAQECLCIVSEYPWFSLFTNILTIVQARRNIGGIDIVVPFLDAVLKHPFPFPGERFVVRANTNSKVLDGTHFLTRPDDDFSTPMGDVNLGRLFRCLDLQQILNVFACALLERRLVFCGSSLANVSACVYAVAALLYPFSWQHIFIPVLPKKLLNYVCAPMPFIVGIHSSMLKEALAQPTEKLVVIDLDNRTVTGAEERISLPRSMVLHNAIQQQLQKQGSPLGAFPNEAILNIFIDYFVSIFGNYRTFIDHVDGKIEFAKEEFLKSKTLDTQAFLEQLGSTQHYNEWIKERIILYGKKEPVGVFENKCAKVVPRAYGLIANTNQSSFNVTKYIDPNTVAQAQQQLATVTNKLSIWTQSLKSNLMGMQQQQPNFPAVKPLQPQQRTPQRAPTQAPARPQQVGNTQAQPRQPQAQVQQPARMPPQPPVQSTKQPSQQQSSLLSFDEEPAAPQQQKEGTLLSFDESQQNTNDVVKVATIPDVNQPFNKLHQFLDPEQAFNVDQLLDTTNAALLDMHFDDPAAKKKDDFWNIMTGNSSQNQMGFNMDDIFVPAGSDGQQPQPAAQPFDAASGQSAPLYQETKPVTPTAAASATSPSNSNNNYPPQDLFDFPAATTAPTATTAAAAAKPSVTDFFASASSTTTTTTSNSNYLDSFFDESDDMFTSLANKAASGAAVSDFFNAPPPQQQQQAPTAPGGGFAGDNFFAPTTTTTTATASGGSAAATTNDFFFSDASSTITTSPTNNATAAFAGGSGKPTTSSPSASLNDPFEF